MSMTTTAQTLAASRDIEESAKAALETAAQARAKSEDAYDLDPTDKARKAALAARDEHHLASSRYEAARRRREQAEQEDARARHEAQAAAAHAEHVRQLREARAALARLEGPREAAVKASEDAAKDEACAFLPDLLQEALTRAASSKATANEKGAAEQDARRAYADAQDRVAELDPDFARALDAERAETTRLDEEWARQEAARRLTVPAFVAEYTARVAPLRRLAAEVLAAHVNAAKALVSEHQKLAVEQGVSALHLRGLEGFARVLNALADIDAPTPAIVDHLSWLAPPESGRASTVLWGLRALGVMAPTPGEHTFRTVLAPHGTVPPRELFEMILAGKSAEIPALDASRKAEDARRLMAMKIVPAAQPEAAAVPAAQPEAAA
jgi:hypothetical protein